MGTTVKGYGRDTEWIQKRYMMDTERIQNRYGNVQNGYGTDTENDILDKEAIRKSDKWIRNRYRKFNLN